MHASPVPDISKRFLSVWARNLAVYRATWRISFLPPILEPILYLLAFGAGLGALVKEVPWDGTTVGYTAFIAPGLVAITIMQNAFFENTFASFVRMYYQKTFDAILCTPVNLDEIVTGEIAWGATKSLLATALMGGVISLFGLLEWPAALLLLPLAALGGLVFGSIAMCFTAKVGNIEMFNLPIFLFITPMFLFGGTFFPLANLPGWAQAVAQLLPLTHLTELCRAAAFGRFRPELAVSAAYLALLALLFFPLAVHLMKGRLIK